jgi:hypothetical protein
MNTHPYLRAYLAGIALPTMFLLVVIAFFTFYRSASHVPIKIERIIIFPMALAPNIWGLWNMLYVALQTRRRLSIGLHGAALPFLLAPLGYALQRGLDAMIWTPTTFMIGFPVSLVIYYLAWKYAVNFFNEVVGVA